MQWYGWCRMSYTDRIRPTDKGITTYLDELRGKNYQIPTFQREIVWDKENVKKLWDSIYKFYPLGSILVWKTDIKLQNHREIGGHLITDDLVRPEYQYILDGQQRTTSLLTSLYGGKVKGREDFSPTLFIDLTVLDLDETDDESYKKRFLFWHEIDDRNGELKANIGKRRKFDEGLIVKLIDIQKDFGAIERRLVENGSGDYQNYDHPYRIQLRRVREVLDNYRVPFIELKGIQVSEVCQIFERINQAGKPLNIFDIVVAKTFRPETNGTKGFYLRELIEDLRDINKSQFLAIDDLTYLQILAILINRNVPGSGIQNITERYLNDIKAHQIEEVWDEAKRAVLKTFDFLENYLYLNGPQLIPYRYLYLTLASYFYDNNTPNYHFLKQYYWFYSFHNEDLLSNTTHLFEHIEMLEQEKNHQNPKFSRFLIDKEKLRTASYSSKGRFSRAILSLYANHEPKDWRNTDRDVLSSVYYILTDRPNLHHIFPVDYINRNPGNNGLNGNSLMNIAYLTQMTNLEISNRNPLEYIQDYCDNPDFERVMGSHLLPPEIIEWARMEMMPANALDVFIEKRIDLIIEALRTKIPSANMEVIDTREGFSG
ncbi:MAG: DUF262 domain-containing protein [Methanoculleus sp.]|jgi:hypothetical protein